MKHTKGPWEWGGTPDDLRLQTVNHGKQFVITFAKNGPRFQTDERMIDATNLLKFEVGNPDVVGHRMARKARSVYRYDVSGIDHPDAHLIAAAPCMKYALELYDIYEAMPADRGGKNGPKGKAYAAFIKAKDEATAKAEGKS